MESHTHMEHPLCSVESEQTGCLHSSHCQRCPFVCDLFVHPSVHGLLLHHHSLAGASSDQTSTLHAMRSNCLHESEPFTRFDRSISTDSSLIERIRYSRRWISQDSNYAALGLPETDRDRRKAGSQRSIPLRGHHEHDGTARRRAGTSARLRQQRAHSPTRF